MTGQQLRNSILQEAIQGRLVPNVLQPREKTGAELLQDILVERQKKENDEKGKKAKKLTLSTIEEEPWDLPDGWCWTIIGDIFDHSAGKSLNSSKQSIGKVYPYLTTSNVYWEGISFDRVKEMAFSEEEYEKCSAIQNDILVCEGGDVGRSCIWTYEYSIGLQNHVHRLRAIKNTDVKYFNYVLRFYKSAGFITAKGIGIGGFSANALKSLSVPLPPLSIQKAIVKKIEELFPLVDEYEKAAVELNTLNDLLPDKLRKSVLQEAIHGNLVSNDIPDGEATAPELLQQILKERQDIENKEKGKKAKRLTLSTVEEEPWNLPEGWCWCKLSDLFNIVSARRVHQSDWRTSGIPFYRTREIGWLADNRTDVKPELFIDESLYEQFKQSGYPTPGDIMMTAVGTVGKTYIVQPGDKFYYKDASVLCLENFSKVSPKYICHLIASDFFKSMIAEEAMGTTVATITMVRANEYLVPLPPLSIQHRIAEKIEEVFSTIDKLQA